MTIEREQYKQKWREVSVWTGDGDFKWAPQVLKKAEKDDAAGNGSHSSSLLLSPLSSQPFCPIFPSSLFPLFLSLISKDKEEEKEKENVTYTGCRGEREGQGKR